MLCICAMALCLFSGVVPVKTVVAADEVSGTTVTSWCASEDFSLVQGEKQWYYILYKYRNNGEIIGYGRMKEVKPYAVPELGGITQDAWMSTFFDYLNVTPNTQLASYQDAGARA